MNRYALVHARFVFLMYIATLSNSNTIEELCKSMLPDDYKYFERPNEDGAVKVYTRLHILDIGEIDEEKMDYLLHMFITHMWRDSRIRLQEPVENPKIPTFIPSECLTYFWQPELYFETAKMVELFKDTAPAIILKVFSDDKVSLSIRYLFRSSCRMQFTNYPFDSQRCEFLMSLIPPDREAILVWAGEKGSPLNDLPEIHILRSIEPLQYSFEGVKTRKIVDVLPDANYTALIADFLFYRRLIGSVINTYIPSTLIVLMSWIGFWLGVEAVPARVALSITSLLTLCTQVQQYQSQLPTVNYIKAMDIWLFVCIFLVFSTLVEFAIAYNVQQNQKHQSNKIQVKVAAREKSRFRRANRFEYRRNQFLRRRSNVSPGSSDETCNLLDQKKLRTGIRDLRAKLRNHSVDEFSQKLYPSFFILFSFSYWAHYLRIYYNHPMH